MTADETKNEEKSKPTAGESLSLVRDRAHRELGKMYIQRRRLSEQLAQLEAKISAYEVDIDAIDKVSGILNAP